MVTVSDVRMVEAHRRGSETFSAPVAPGARALVLELVEETLAGQAMTDLVAEEGAAASALATACELVTLHETHFDG